MNRTPAHAHLMDMATIRTAHPADVDAIARVVNAAFEVERPFRRSGNRTSPADVRELMQQHTFFLAEHGGRIIGSVFVRITGQTGYFGMLAVEAAHQRAGVGRVLRERAEAFCRERGCRRMTLTTGDFRAELLPYYERAGYKVVGTEPGPAEWGLNQPFKMVHMSKEL